jgi:hypothetical protein
MNKEFLIAIIIGVLITWLLISAKNSNKNQMNMDKYELTENELIKHVKLAINPKFENWILFKNGTYIINEDASNEKEIEKQGLEQMKEFGPVHGGGPAGDFGTITLNKTEGWVVSGHGYGMYTYVHPSEIDKDNPEDYEIGLYGRGKRNEDGEKPEIICLSSNGKIIKHK